MAGTVVPFRRPASSQKQRWWRRAVYWITRPSAQWGGGYNDGSRTGPSAGPLWLRRLGYWLVHPSARWGEIDAGRADAARRARATRYYRGCAA